MLHQSKLPVYLCSIQVIYLTFHEEKKWKYKYDDGFSSLVSFHFYFLLYNPSPRKKTENLLDRIISLDLQNYDLLQRQIVFFFEIMLVSMFG